VEEALLLQLPHQVEQVVEVTEVLHLVAQELTQQDMVLVVEVELQMVVTVVMVLKELLLYLFQQMNLEVTQELQLLQQMV